MLRGEQIICISSVDWDYENWMRHHQIMSRLAKYNQVLYVESSISILSPFKYPVRWRKWIKWAKGIRKVGENLYVYSPPIVLPFSHKSLWINRFNQKILLKSLLKIVRRARLNNPILWLYTPFGSSYIGKFNEKLACYDCADEITAFAGATELVGELERDLLQKVNIVFTSATRLYENKKKINPNTYLVTNAGEAEHYSRVLSGKCKIPNDIADIKHPIIGFFGGISDWIDLDLLEYIARIRPQWSFFMIGPIMTNISQLQRLSNVRFVGLKSYEQLPDYVKIYDVCIIPFKINKLTASVNPVKLYEYLAAGKPVVSTALPEVEKFRDVIDIAKNKEDFLSCLTHIIEQGSRTDNEIKKRVKIALENSWDSRVESISKTVWLALDKKGS